MNQHFIPRGYLKAWCDPDTPQKQEPYVWVFEKNGKNPRKKAPKSIFNEPNMYDFKDETNAEPFTYEDLFQKIEDKFCKLRERIIYKLLPLSEENKADLLFFVAVMHCRTPNQREHLKKFHNDLKNGVDSILENHGTASKEQIEEYKKSIDYQLIKESAENPHKRMMPIQLQTEYTSYYKYQLKVTIFETADDPGFITSDSPWHAVDIEAHKRPPPYDGPGLAFPSTEVRLPLSPRHFLFLHHQEIPPYVKVGEKVVGKINWGTRVFADEYFVVQRNVKKDVWFEPEVSSSQ